MRRVCSLRNLWLCKNRPVAKEAGNEPKGDPTADAPRVDFHFIKSNLFRVIHCDGVWGGIAPSGLLHVSVFSERAAIPKHIANALTDQGKPGQEILREGRTGYVREIDADIVMGIETAKLLRDWLSARVTEFDEMQRALQKLQQQAGTGSKQ
jgi:hypothetical protein